MAPPVEVLYIAAKGRSGSTVLGRLLGAIDGFAFVGEVRLGLRNLVQDRRCGCGARIRDCPAWQAVGHRAGALFDPAVFAEQGGVRMRHLPAALLGRDAALRARLGAQVEAVERLYRAVQAVHGCRVIVDTSKSTAYGYLLSLAPAVRLHVVHLVRDPRAIAHSWTKERARPDYPGHHTRLRGPVDTAATWAISNVWAELCWRRASGGRLRLRYEDFAARPVAAVRAIAALAGAAPDARLPFVDEQTAELGPSHSVAGNVNRMESGRIAIRPDEEWRRAMSPAARRLVGALTAPLRGRYGYGARPVRAWDPWRPDPHRDPAPR